MKTGMRILVWCVLAGVLSAIRLAAAADDEKRPQDAAARSVVTKTTLDDVPEGFKGFAGVIVGRLVTKDFENGSLVITVDAIHGTGPRNQAKAPKNAIGKTLPVDGYSGEFLDRLVLMKPGDTLRTYVVHNSGNGLKFQGEGLAKVEPVTPEDYPELPEEFRSFQGVVVGTIVKKNLDANELIIRVEKIEKTGEKSQAKNAASIVGKPLRLAGFYTQKVAFRELTIGETIKCGVEHQRKGSDDLTMIEFSRQASDAKPAAGPAVAKATRDDLPDDMKGFVGMLVGRVASKDIENGTFLITIDAIAYTAPRSKAKNPKNAVGKTLAVDGLTGEFLDRLLLIKPGETLWFGADQNHDNWLTFGGEGFQKVDPVQPGDYPEMLEDFRAFQGVIVGTIEKKNVGTLELIVRVNRIKETSEKSQAKNPASIIGKPVRLTGFGPRREEFKELKDGETIECGLQHTSRAYDFLTVSGPIRKVGDMRPNGDGKN